MSNSNRSYEGQPPTSPRIITRNRVVAVFIQAPRRRNIRPIVWVAHEVSGDVEGNLAKITKICEKIQRSGVQPFFPSFTSRRYETKLNPEESLAQVTTFFEAGFIDELWLYGPGISEGMLREINLARANGIRVVAKTRGTRAALKKLQ